MIDRLWNWFVGHAPTDEEIEMRHLRKVTLKALREYDHGKRRFGAEGGRVARKFAQRHADSLGLLDPIDVSAMTDAEVEDFLTEGRYAAFTSRYPGE